MANLKSFSPAKINLYLKVFERLANGYHRIETVMIKLKFGDDVELNIEEGDGLEIHVPNHPDLENEKNLGARAIRSYFEPGQISKNVKLRIDKRIPLGAGLGGGSSNAAIVLRMLVQILGPVSEELLFQKAVRLGADVPFFLQGSSLALAKGVGEELTPWPNLPSIPVVLVNPAFPISTPTAYQGLSRPLTWNPPDGSSIAPRNTPKNWSDLHRLLEVGNDLQEVVERGNPVIGTIRERLKQHGAFFAQMSGSGSTVFGLFEDPNKAREAAEILGHDWKTFWTETA